MEDENEKHNSMSNSVLCCISQVATFINHQIELERTINFHSFLEMKRREKENLSCSELSCVRINFVLKNTDIVWVLSTLLRRII